MEGVARLLGVAARLQDTLSLVDCLPRHPVEPSVIAIDCTPHELTALAVLRAPIGISSSRVACERIPRLARPGHRLTVPLVVRDSVPESALAVSFLGQHVDAVARCGDSPVRLPVELSAHVGLDGASGVLVAIAVPRSAEVGSVVFVDIIRIAGEPIILRPPNLWPLRIPVSRCVDAPLVLVGAASDESHGIATPAINSDGELYAPVYSRPAVLAFAADGRPLPPIELPSLKLASSVRVVAFCEAKGIILLSGANVDGTPNLVAIDASSRSLQWSAPTDGVCFGVALLPSQDVVVAGDRQKNALRIFRLADGTRTSSLKVQEPSFLAALETEDIVYVSASSARGTYSILSFRYADSCLVSEGEVVGAGRADNYRPIAVIPAIRHAPAYLVVSTRDTPELCILALPGGSLVHTHTCEGMRIHGLAADPSGAAVAVCDTASGAVHVLPFPLPGMPSE
jgi:hypothetical protein